jgi:ActR/RegA family two-component response regulator
MAESPLIVFSERLSTGIMVHFENAVSVFFPAAFLYDQRDAELNRVFREDEEGDDPQHRDGDYPQYSEAADDAPYGRVAESSDTPRSTEATSKQAKHQKTKQPKILVVDDNERVRTSIGKVLKAKEFQIATAANVGEALHLIDTKPFDVLLSNLHMTEEGDGLAAVSAMHKTNPQALTLVYTGFPELERVLDVILEADEGLAKPEAFLPLLEPTHERLEVRETRQATDIELVAAILERDTSGTIIDWLDRVERDGELTRVPLSREERTGHLPRLILELAYRLRAPLSTKTVLGAAVEQGKLRHSQGYSIAMIVEEFCILQVSIFETLYNRVSTEDFQFVLADAKTITDECDSQLRQTLASFMRQAAKIAA